MGYTHFILIPNQQIQHGACILMKLNNHGNKMGKKIEHVFMEYTPVPKQQVIVQIETKVDNYRSRYIWFSVSKEGYQQEIELCVASKGILACSKRSATSPHD